MMNDLGLGIVVSMKDAFTQNAHRIQSAMMSLDSTVAKSSERMNRNLDRIQKGTMMVGAGLALMTIPTVLLASTAATQKALGELSSVGVQKMQAIEDAAESFTNQWAGANKADFIGAAYDVKSALSNLSDEAVGTFSGMAALTGKATKATTQEMVGTFTTAYGIFKPIMADMSDMEWATAFSGGMAQTVASFKTTGAQMADAIKNIGAVAASSNVPLQEQLAILGQLQTTMPGSEAGTLYKAFIMKAAEAGDELGLSFTDTTGRLKSVIPILQEIQSKFPDLSQAAAQVQLKKAFGSDEAVKFVLQMSAGMQTLEGNIRTVEQAMAGGTVVTERMASAMNQDIGARFTLLKQQIGNLTEILGRSLLPVVVPIMQGLSGLVLRLQKFAKSIPGITRVVLTFSMALGGILVAAGAVMAGVGMIGVMLPAVQAGFVALGTAAAGVGSVIAAWFLPVTAIVAGVVLAVVLLRKAWRSNFGGIQNTLTGAWERVRLVFSGIRQLITSLSSGVGQMSGETAEKLQQVGLLGFVVTVFKAYYRVRQFLTGMSTAFAHAFSRIKAILEPAIVSMMGAYKELYSAIFSIVEAFGVVAGAADAEGFRSIGSVIGALLGSLVKFAAYVIKYSIVPMTILIRTIAVVVRAGVWMGQTFATAFAQTGAFLYRFWLPLRLLVNAFIAAGRIVKAFWDVISGNATLLEGLRSVGVAVLEYLATPFDWAREIARAFWNFISGTVTTIGLLISSAITTVVTQIQNMPLISTISQMISGALALLTGNGSFFEAGKKLLVTFGEGILAAATYPIDALKTTLGKLRNLLPFSDAREGPLSALTSSGASLLSTFAEGMNREQQAPTNVFAQAAESILATVTNVWQGLKSGASDALTSAANKLRLPGNTAIPKIDAMPIPQQAIADRTGLNATISNPVTPIPQNSPSVRLAAENPTDLKLTGILDLVPNILSRMMPAALTSALMLNPVLAGALPVANQSIEGSRPATIVAPAMIEPTLAAPQVSMARSFSLRDDREILPVADSSQDISRTRTFVPPRASQAATADDSAIREILTAILQRIGSLENRPVDVNVKTTIDGRQVAEAVYKDLRERKVRNYETL